MALTFGAGTADRVSHGSAASLDNLPSSTDGMTVLQWVYVTTRTDTRKLSSKGRGTAGVGWQLGLSGTTGNLQMLCERATTDAFRITSDTPVAANTWTFVAADAKTSASPVTHIYTGTLTTIAVESSYGTDQDGSGSYGADAARDFMGGNIDNTTPNLALQGRIAWIGLWNRVLSLGEIQDQQFYPHVTSGCVLFSHYGYNGTSTQPDWSGNGNSGTVTSATLTPDHVPIRAYSSRRIREWRPYAGTVNTALTPAQAAVLLAGLGPSLGLGIGMPCES
jgi:hypothetical protein